MSSKRTAAGDTGDDKKWSVIARYWGDGVTSDRFTFDGCPEVEWPDSADQPFRVFLANKDVFFERRNLLSLAIEEDAR